MKLTREQAEVFEEYLASEGWITLLSMIAERLGQKTDALKSGRLDHEQYIETCAAIRELEYLRDEPQRLVRKSYAEKKNRWA